MPEYPRIVLVALEKLEMEPGDVIRWDYTNEPMSKHYNVRIVSRKHVVDQHVRVSEEEILKHGPAQDRA